MGKEIRALSVEEAAKAAGVGRTLLFEEIRKGRLTARKAGRRTIVTIDELDSWLKSLPKTTDRTAGDLEAFLEALPRPTHEAEKGVWEIADRRMAQKQARTDPRRAEQISPPGHDRSPMLVPRSGKVSARSKWHHAARQTPLKASWCA
jgi:excisionase family DNA binding protein